jgi:hypothetical protein
LTTWPFCSAVIAYVYVSLPLLYVLHKADLWKCLDLPASQSFPQALYSSHSESHEVPGSTQICFFALSFSAILPSCF